MKPLLTDLSDMIQAVQTANEIVNRTSATTVMRQHFTQLLALDESFFETVGAALTPEELNLYKLRMVDGLDCEEIAERLHLNRESVIEQMAAIRERVTVMLEKEIKRPLIP